MRRRTAAFIMILLFVPVLLFSAAQFWVLDSTDWLNPTSSTDYYRFNFQTVLNLDQQFKQPSYSSYDYGNTQYISSMNAIASVGVSGCEHKIIYTIDTHGGVFRSQSDTSKYRSFYVVASPDYTVYHTSDICTYFGTQVGDPKCLPTIFLVGTLLAPWSRCQSLHSAPNPSLWP